MSQNVGMSSCCLSGKVHEGKPVGREDQIGGLETYISEPQNGSKEKTIIFICDSTSSPPVSSHPPLKPLTNPSLRLQIPQHPPPRRRIRQSRLLHLRPRYPRRRLPPHFLPRQHRAQPKNAGDAWYNRQSQKRRPGPRNPRSLASQTSRRRLQTPHRRLRKYRPHDPRHEQDRCHWILLGREICDFASAWAGEGWERK